jgi:uncharacterized membrane protein YdjX (TVP38/TMEM64 family)
MLGNHKTKNQSGETLIPRQKTPASPFPLARLALVAALVCGAAAFFLLARHYVSLQALAEHRIALRALVMENFCLSVLLYAAIYALAIIFLFPTALALTLTGGFLFGWQIGATLTLIAATTGATVVFLLARTALAEPLIRRAGPFICKVRDGFQKDAFTYLLFLRLVPAFPFWVMNLAPALLGMNLRDFILATAIGIIPGTLAFSFIGSGIDGVLAMRHETYLDCLRASPPPETPCRFELDPTSFVTPQLIVALMLLGVIAILPAIVKRLWKSKASRA